MAYENFKISDVRLAKIVANARKFDIPALQNEELLKVFFDVKIGLGDSERENIERIFTALINVEESIQLSK